MNAISGRAAKRRRRRPPQPYSHTTAAEERYLQQAIRNSKLDTRRTDGALDVEWAPTFYPTVEDFEGNPLDYIEKIRPVAQKYGVCKIVPPNGWNPPFCVDMKSPKPFQTKLQQLHRLQEGISFGDGQECSSAEYQRQASEQAKAYQREHYPDHEFYQEHAESLLTSTTDGTEMSSSTSDVTSKFMSPNNLERDYWEIVETHTRQVSVAYGNDVDTDQFGSGFPLSERGRAVAGTTDPAKVDAPEPKIGDEDYYKETWWNLNNIPQAPDSVLRHVKVGINGINVPWMYHGCLFSTFCWHNEDNYLYSINYHHRGAPKQWYGVPGTKKDSDGLEKVFKSYLSMKMRDVPDLLHHITTMFSPRLLQNNDVNVYKLLQHAGEFVVTFPRAFHGGFSLGPNVGEAVNFATHDWIEFGADANERYRSFARPAVFSHDRLTFTMANHLSNQKSYRTCKLLLQELERVVDEELQFRQELIRQGVRDVSDMVSLPANRLDQLDAQSADYDDKRLCHGCKHVCFFSAVACECSQSKVSCLRHSHYMCRCPKDRKYLLIWSNQTEMETTLQKVREYCDALKQAEEQHGIQTSTQDMATPPTDATKVMADDQKAGLPSLGKSPKNPTPHEKTLAPGVAEDLKAHRHSKLNLDPVIGDANYQNLPLKQNHNNTNHNSRRQKMSMGGASATASPHVASDENGDNLGGTDPSSAAPLILEDGVSKASRMDSARSGSAISQNA